VVSVAAAPQKITTRNYYHSNMTSKFFYLFPETLFGLLMVKTKCHTTIPDQPSDDNATTNNYWIVWWMETFVFIQMLLLFYMEKK
jgi:hypothetical protein